MHKTWQTHKKMRSFYRDLVMIETCAFHGGSKAEVGEAGSCYVIASAEVSKVGTCPPWGGVMTGAAYSCEGVSRHRWKLCTSMLADWLGWLAPPSCSDLSQLTLEGHLTPRPKGRSVAHTYRRAGPVAPVILAAWGLSCQHARPALRSCQLTFQQGSAFPAAAVSPPALPRPQSRRGPGKEGSPALRKSALTQQP